jgi:poly(A) polymerase
MSEKLSPPWLEWPETKQLIAALPDIRFVGGAVRDALLGKPVQDVDAALARLPEATLTALKKADIKAIPTGIEHGTVTAVIGKKHFEITTLRKDISTDGRHAKVAYTDDWQQDAARRDFTINALYLSPQGELFDYFGGAQDARRGHVRFIGEAKERIAEDYLRILRFFRFYAWYGKTEPDGQALMACAAAASDMKTLSGERVQQEMLKLLAAPNCHLTIDLMHEHGLLPHLFGFAIRDTGMLARFDALPTAPPFLKLMGFILISDIPADAALDKICERLRLSNTMSDSLRQAFLHYDEINADLPEAAQKKLLRRLGAENFCHAVLVQWARGSDLIGKDHPYVSMLKLAETWQPPEFPVTGDDLIALGITPGKEMGSLLKRLEEKWEASHYTLTKEKLLMDVKPSDS